MSKYVSFVLAVLFCLTASAAVAAQSSPDALRFGAEGRQYEIGTTFSFGPVTVPRIVSGPDGNAVSVPTTLYRAAVQGHADVELSPNFALFALVEGQNSVGAPADETAVHAGWAWNETTWRGVGGMRWRPKVFAAAAPQLIASVPFGTRGAGLAFSVTRIDDPLILTAGISAAETEARAVVVTVSGGIGFVPNETTTATFVISHTLPRRPVEVAVTDVTLRLEKTARRGLPGTVEEVRSVEGVSPAVGPAPTWGVETGLSVRSTDIFIRFGLTYRRWGTIDTGAAR